ncbi:stonustoxin subunit alpha-like isoform X1 [Brienomyrus brachyistius]|uniref:stonustoxin subunit alpha-like isoform X1 n=1 Tax=Brienomyrus brachyistius TaxID=42636 RepID=UPI0020B2148D|nr:stonustoxin subunit alpha-like isoform X1 [Brienomyrus brachyistius]
MSFKTIQIAALGRPLHPGMLYDCRNDSFIPGVTLWDAENIEKNMTVHEQNQTKSEITTSDSLSKKSSLLDISASLKVSFLGDLIEVGGSAKYLKDTLTLESQCRVTMHFSQKTVFKQLNMKNIGRITYADVIKHGTATHVVTGVLYGADAFLIFDQTTSRNEDKQDIQGSLEVMVKKIPLIPCGGGVKLEMTDEEQKKVEKLHCTFYGDVKLEENPTTYMEAVKIYKDLPRLLGERGEKAVPMTVWLYPLKYLDKRAAKLVREIRENLIIEVESTMEDLQRATITVNELLQVSKAMHATDIQDKLKTFQDMLRQYKINILKNISILLPIIRKGAKNEKALEEILKYHHESHFTQAKMKNWLDEKRTELDVIRTYTDVFENQKNIPIVSSTQHNGCIFNPQYESVITFVFTSLKYEEPYILDLNKFLPKTSIRKNTSDSFRKVVEDDKSKPWFLTSDISQSMRQTFDLFSIFSDINVEEKKNKFVIAYISDPIHPGASIYLHQNGKLVDTQYKPKIKPTSPVALDIRDRSISLKPQFPISNPMPFRVEFKKENGVKDWRLTDTTENQENWIISGLKPDTIYLLRYKVCADVDSEPSEPVKIHTKTFSGMIKSKIK